jgi:hypothetical protein
MLNWLWKKCWLFLQLFRNNKLFFKTQCKFSCRATPLCTGAYPGCITFDLYFQIQIYFYFIKLSTHYVIALSIELNLNIEELIMSIVLLIPCICTIKLHIFFINKLIFCFLNFLKKWLFINYFKEKSTKYQLF